MDLEPTFHSIQDGTKIDLVVQPSFVAADFTVVSTCAHQQIAFSDITLAKCAKFTMLGIQKKTIAGRIWLVRNDETLIIEHGPVNVRSFQVSTEVCAGIGASTVGFQACGVRTEQHVENNPVFVKWLEQKGKKVIAGDVSNPQVASKLAETYGGILSGECHVSPGVPCAIRRLSKMTGVGRFLAPWSWFISCRSHLRC